MTVTDLREGTRRSSCRDDDETKGPAREPRRKDAEFKAHVKINKDVFVVASPTPADRSERERVRGGSRKLHPAARTEPGVCCARHAALCAEPVCSRRSHWNGCRGWTWSHYLHAFHRSRLRARIRAKPRTVARVRMNLHARLLWASKLRHVLHESARMLLMVRLLHVAKLRPLLHVAAKVRLALRLLQRLFLLLGGKVFFSRLLPLAHPWVRSCRGCPHGGPSCFFRARIQVSATDECAARRVSARVATGTRNLPRTLGLLPHCCLSGKEHLLLRN